MHHTWLDAILAREKRDLERTTVRNGRSSYDGPLSADNRGVFRSKVLEVRG